MKGKILPLLLLALFCWTGASAQRFAAKTNLLYWATATPNLGIEAALSKHSTLSISANYNPWVFGYDAKIQHWFVQPEYRYWFTEKYTRSYVGVHVLGGEFEIGGFTPPLDLFKRMANRHYKGSVVAAGVSYGYQFYISPHWNLEASVGVGIARLNYHAELTSDPKDKRYGNRTRYLPIPTQVGITFVYLFNSRKK